MANDTSTTVADPIPISMVAGRYLLFDIDAVTYLRRTYNICGVLIGSIPQVPQQNVFLGLPLELLPEEVQCLVDKRAAYIVDDAMWHTRVLSNLDGEQRQKYLQSLRAQGRKAQQTAQRESQKRSEKGLARQALKKASNDASSQKVEGFLESSQDAEDEETSTVFGSTMSKESKQALQNSLSFKVTPANSKDLLSLPEVPSRSPTIPLPSSYPLFAYLHNRNYFITPGLRFGCDYSVYPGDPLRFHSHFLAVGYDWNEEIPLLDLVGGGRLGTGVKKGFLIGGKDTSTDSEGDEAVRTFCIEWGGM